MKLKTYLFSLLLFTSLIASAQSRFGVLGGLNSASMSDGFLEKADIGGSISFHIGALYEYQFSDKISFRPKLVFSKQGDREKTSNSFIDVRSIDYKLSYLNLPLNFKFFEKPYIIAGPQIGFLLSTDKQSADFGDVESKVDYGLNIGTGYDFKDFFIELNIYQGLATLVQFDSVVGQSVAVDATNTVIQLSFGYYFE